MGINKHNKALWKIECFCGEFFHKTSTEIIQAKVKSCGCLRKNKFKVGDMVSGIEYLKKIRATKDGSIWEFKCHCGELFEKYGKSVAAGNILSCGCVKNKGNTTHGDSQTRLYHIWSHMKARCYNPNTEFYYCYGELGVTVCDEWKGDFAAFRGWAIKNGYQEDLSIDRIDAFGNYEPSNCRWADWETQARNKRVNKNSESGCVGVKKQGEYWRAGIHHNRKEKHLIYTRSLVKAIEARKQGEIKYWGKEHQDFDSILRELENNNGN